MARKNKKAGAAPLTSPQTREEMYLANIAGLVNTKPEYPFTRTERYLDAISSGTSGLADRVTALETDKVNVIGKGVNLFDNAYFIGGGTAGAFPINQRGYTDSLPGYGEVGIDRWNMYSATGSLQADGLHLGEGEAILQKLDSYLLSALNGKQITISALTSLGLFSGHITLDTSAGVQYVTTTGFTMFKTATNDFQMNTQSAVTLFAVKLELGTQQTLARQINGEWVLNDTPPNYQQELAKCQRYLCKFAQYMDFMPSGETNTDAFVTVPVCMTRKPDIIGNIAGGTNWDVIIYSPYSNQLRIRSATAITGAVECDGDVYFSAE